MPSTPLDAYGLLISAIKDPNPVLFMNPKSLMRVRGDEKIPGEPDDDKKLRSMIDMPVDMSAGARSGWKPRWPALEEYSVPIGVGRLVHEGRDATIVSYGRLLPICKQLATKLNGEGFSLDVIDLRSMYPYDWQMIKKSIEKTGRVLFVNEETEVTNFAEHLSYRVTKELFYQLHAAPRVLAGKNVPGVGLHPNLEEATLPQAADVEREIRELVKEMP